MQQAALFFNIDDVRRGFQEDLKNGQHADCPCCGRYAQIYRRKFHSSMAYQLMRLYRMGGNLRFIHASKLILPNMAGIGDFTKAKYWGLIIPKDKAIYDTETDKKSSGFWRITPEGEKFIKGLIAIPHEVYVFDDQVLGVSHEGITIRDALGTKFDYQQLLEGNA
jgi:hypothetical protein